MLFAFSSPEYLRFYDDTIVELTRRGHQVIVGVDTIREGKPVRLDSLHGLPAVTVAGLVPTRNDAWTPLVRAIRGTMDFVRYLHPRLAGATVLRARAKRQALPWVLGGLDRTREWPPSRVTAWMMRLARLEAVVPPARETTDFLRLHAPDLVLVSPLVEMVSNQVDVVRSAQAMGIPVGALVASWDNLTNKGDLRAPADRVFVWNDAQAREAVELHRVEAGRIVVTGAAAFDRWFGRQPNLDRQAFCRNVGLPSDAPFVLFTGSSIFIARAEVEIPFIRRWITALRSADDPAVRNLNVLVRPHPYNGRAWGSDALADLDGVAVWPRGGYDPIDDGNRSGFFDSMYHAEAVVGINTSAMIESAIVGRPVLSILEPEFAGTQRGTLHFHHLLPDNGGFLRVASSLGEHVGQLSAVLANPAAARTALARFVASFIRPRGLDHRAAPLLASALEDLGRAPRRAPMSVTLAPRILRVALLPVAVAARWCRPESERKGRLIRAARVSGSTLRRLSRLGGRAGRAGWHETRSNVARACANSPRLAERLFRSVVTRPIRHTGRAIRHARYHVAVLSRRVRGLPIE